MKTKTTNVHFWNCFLFLISIVLLALASCSIGSRQVGKEAIRYKASLIEFPAEKVVVVDAISNSGTRVISHVDPGVILHFKDTSDSVSRYMALETLQNPDAKYKIVDSKWTRIIRICLEKERGSADIVSIVFRLQVGTGSELVKINVHKGMGSVKAPLNAVH